MRRKTRPRVVWLPQTNANSIGDFRAVYQLKLLSLSGDTEARTTAELPLVMDAQQGLDDPASASLSDIESSGYRLRRIVGKIWVQVGAGNPNDGGPGPITPQSAIVTAGIMVRRANTINGLSLAQLTGEAQIDPSLIDNAGDPWVWRRSWWLGKKWARGTFIEPAANIFVPTNAQPSTNYGADYPGGIAEGPHVDQKTARIVSSEERLFLSLSATVLAERSEGTVDAEPMTIAVVTDLRILGSLRTSSGNRRNASR